MQRNVRRGLRELRIASITTDQLITHGVQAFCDTVRRHGYSSGTPEAFRQYYSWRGRCRGHVFLGAWKDDQLAAFLSITEVDDWAEIEGCFSMDSLLQLRPNDTLLFYALTHYLTERSCELVDYGLSSLQPESNRAGLHAFKTKVGFEPRPVHRAFVVHPILRLFVNHLTLWSVNTVLRLRPGDRRLQKAGGVLASMLGQGQMPMIESRNEII
jgi:hypothetical protein